MRLQLSAFLAYVSLSCVIPVIPKYAMLLGASSGEAAIISGSFALSTAIAMIPFSFAAAKLGRSSVMYGGALLNIAASASYILAPSPKALLFARLLHGFGSAMFVPTLTASVAADAEKRGEAIGWLTFAMMLGFSVGPVFGGFLAEFGIAKTFQLSLASSLLSLAMLQRREGVESFSWVSGDFAYYAAIFIATLCSSAYALFLFPAKLSPSQSGAAISILFLASALSRIPAGYLSDRIGCGKTVAAGAVIESLGPLAANSLATAALCGVGMGIVNTAAFARVARGSLSVGVANTFLNLGIFLGSVFGGLVYSLGLSTLLIAAMSLGNVSVLLADRERN